MRKNKNAFAGLAVFFLLNCVPSAPASAQTAQPNSISFADKALILKEGTTKAITIAGHEPSSETTINVVVKKGARDKSFCSIRPIPAQGSRLSCPKTAAA